MSFPLARNVYQLLRGASRQQSLERLRREGHRNVPVLRFSDIESLIGAAVDDTLSALALQLSESTVEGLTEEARTRFLALVRERDELRNTLRELSEQQVRLSTQQDTVRAEIERAESELAEERHTGRSGLDSALTELVADLLGQLEPLLDELPGADSARVTEVRAQIRTTVTAACEAARQRIAERARGEQSARVEQLRRRIARLRRKLDESELLLARARANGHDDPLRRFEVGQALQPGDDGYAAKRALLDEIFQMNVELNRIIAGQADKADPAPENSGR